jgi:glycosyltransferase involved in cell wall biosynthesis
MRILHVIGNSQVAGAERVVFDLTRELIRRKQHVTVMCSVRTAKFFGASHARVVPTLNPGLLGHLFGMLALMIIQRRFDIVHLHDSSALIAFGMQPLQPSSRIITTIHGPDQIALLQRRATSFRSRFVQVFTRRACLLSDEIVGVSTNIVDKFVGLNKAVATVQNGVDAATIRSEARHGVVSQLRELRDEGFTIATFPGRLDTRTKGQDVALRSIALLVGQGARICLILVGDGKDAQMLRKMTRELGVENNVFFLGYLPRREELACMFHADLIITHLVNHEHNGVSQVHLEAAVLRKPLITVADRDLGAFKDGFFCVASPDPQKLASMISYIVEHPEEARKRVHKANVVAKNSFSWAGVADTYLRIYEPKGKSVKSPFDIASITD